MPPYIEVPLTSIEIYVATQVAAMRRIGALQGGGGEAYGRGDDDKNWDDNIVGAMGELAFGKGMGVYWPMLVNEYRHGPPDFPPNIEIKTLGRHDFDLTIRPDAHDERAYVLVTGKATPFRIHGWRLGADKERFGTLDDFGNNRPPLWRIKQRDLRPLSELLLQPTAGLCRAQ